MSLCYRIVPTLALVVSVAMSGCESSPSEEAPGPEAAEASTAANDEETTRTVVQRHLATFGAGDLEGILADYADDAVMFTPNGPIVGKEALRTAFQAFIVEWGQPGTTFNLTREDYEGEHGYINWVAETGANVYGYGVDGFTVRDGKIVVQFFGASTTPKGQ